MVGLRQVDGMTPHEPGAQDRQEPSGMEGTTSDDTSPALHGTGQQLDQSGNNRWPVWCDCRGIAPL